MLDFLETFLSQKVTREEIGYIRGLGVIGRLCGVSEEVAEAVVKRGLCGRLFSAAGDKDDPLLQISVLELLGPLGSSAITLRTLLDSPLLDCLCVWAGVSVSEDTEEAEVSLLADASLSALAHLHSCAPTKSPEKIRLSAKILPGLLTLIARVCDGELEGRDPVQLLSALSLAAPRDAAILGALLSEESGGVAAATEISGVAVEQQQQQQQQQQHITRTCRGGLRSWLELVESSSLEYRAAALGALAACCGGPCAAEYALPLMGALGLACFGDKSAGVTMLERAVSGVRVLERVLSRAVPAGDTGNEGAHWCRGAAFACITALVSLGGESGIKAVYYKGGRDGVTSFLWRLVVEGAAPEASSAGRASLYRLMVATLENSSAVLVLGEDGVEKLRVRVARGAHAKNPIEPTVLVNNGEYI